MASALGCPRGGRRRRPSAERARPRDDPRVPQDRPARGALDPHAREFPAGPRAPLGARLPAGGLNALLDGSIALPAGTTPVVLTFDDSSPGQFRYVEKNGNAGYRPRVRRRHPRGLRPPSTPDFGHAATFYVLPGANPPEPPFNQPELAERKLQYLANHGYEIGNHTLWHANLGKYARRWCGPSSPTAQAWVQRYVPGYRFRTLALPHGGYPRGARLGHLGQLEGHDLQPRRHPDGGRRRRAVSATPRRSIRLRLPRIQAVEQRPQLLADLLRRNPGERYVSDGEAATITVPRPAARSSAATCPRPSRWWSAS